MSLSKRGPGWKLKLGDRCIVPNGLATEGDKPFVDGGNGVIVGWAGTLCVSAVVWLNDGREITVNREFLRRES